LEIAESCPAPIDAALAAAAVALGSMGHRDLRPEPALAAARVVGALTDDAALALGVLAQESGATRAAAAATLPIAELQRLFGAEPLGVAGELDRLGDFGRGVRWSGDKLQETQAETLRKMLLAVVGDPRLVIARIGMQLARLRAAKDLPPTEREALAAETRAVFAPLANRLGVWQVKWELEDLAFRYLEPDDYKRIAAALNERRADRETYIRDLCASLATELRVAGIEAEVYGRPKHIYSIHRKMQRKQLAFEQLFDVRAVRILCRTLPDCYAALGVVHGRYPYIPGEFDDYVATPKENLYRSIHTAVIGPQGRAVEVQIRTQEMHEHAELGVAAHWRYKEGGARDAGYERKIEWVRRLLAPAEAVDSDAGGGDFIETVRTALFEDRIYAMTPKGEVVDLPRGATPLDFAYHVHTSLGHRCRGAKVNGRIVPLTAQLTNGAVVEIITGKQEAPSRDWLSQEEGFLASPRSRSKVRTWFRKQDAGENEAAGRAIAERELARLGAGPDLLAALVGDLKASDARELHRWLGEGEVSTAQLQQAVARRLPAARANALARRKPTPAKSARRTSSPVDIEGEADLPITLARCCTPVRPQPIAGYVTLGRGVTVHAAGCSGLRRMSAAHPERALAATWRADAADAMPVEITVQAWDRQGLVRDLSEVIASSDLGIDALTTTTDRKAGTARSVMRVAVKDLAQLSKLLRALSGVGSVISARRSG
jgi:GTP pyrophosphokinase